MIIASIFLLIVYINIFIITKIQKKNNEAFNNFADTAIITRNQMHNYSPMFDIEGTIEEQRKRGI